MQWISREPPVGSLAFKDSTMSWRSFSYAAKPILPKKMPVLCNIPRAGVAIETDKGVAPKSIGGCCCTQPGMPRSHSDSPLFNSVSKRSITPKIFLKSMKDQLIAKILLFPLAINQSKIKLWLFYLEMAANDRTPLFDHSHQLKSAQEELQRYLQWMHGLKFLDKKPVNLNRIPPDLLTEILSRVGLNSFYYSNRCLTL